MVIRAGAVATALIVAARIALQQCRATRNKRLRHPVLMGAFGVKATETVSIVVIVLLVAVIGRAILDPPRVR